MKNIYKYVPSVVLSVIEIYVVLLVLDKGYSDKTISAGLVIIYAAIRNIGIGLAMSLSSMTMGIAVDLTKIKERIRKDDDTEEEWGKITAGNEKTSTTHYKLIIRAIGVFIIYIIGLFALLG